MTRGQLSEDEAFVLAERLRARARDVYPTDEERADDFATKIRVKRLIDLASQRQREQAEKSGRQVR